MPGQRQGHGHKDHIDDAGTPRAHTLYAVFDTQDGAREAERALKDTHKQNESGTHVLRGEKEAQRLRQENQTGRGGNLLTKLERAVKRLGGETRLAERYAAHLELGRTVLVVDVDHEDIDGLVDSLTSHGAYDVVYFSGGSIEHLSPAENAARGIPTEDMASSEELKGE